MERIQTSVMLDPDLLENIDKLKDPNIRNRSHFIELAIREYLKRLEADASK